MHAVSLLSVAGVGGGGALDVRADRDRRQQPRISLLSARRPRHRTRRFHAGKASCLRRGYRSAANRAKPVIMKILLIMLLTCAAPLAASAACNVDADCPGASCGGQVCKWGAGGHVCVAAGT